MHGSKTIVFFNFCLFGYRVLCLFSTSIGAFFKFFCTTMHVHKAFYYYNGVRGLYELLSNLHNTTKLYSS